MDEELVLWPPPLPLVMLLSEGELEVCLSKLDLAFLDSNNFCWLLRLKGSNESLIRLFDIVSTAIDWSCYSLLAML